MNTVMEDINKLNAEEKKKICLSLLSEIIGEDSSNILCSFVSVFSKLLPNNLYDSKQVGINKKEESGVKSFLNIEDLKPGDELRSKAGLKHFEIRSRSSIKDDKGNIITGFKIFLYATQKEHFIDDDYLRTSTERVRVRVKGGDIIDVSKEKEVKESNIERKTEKNTEKQTSIKKSKNNPYLGNPKKDIKELLEKEKHEKETIVKNKEIEKSEVKAAAKKAKKKITGGEKTMKKSNKGTIRNYIISALTESPKTKEELANAVMEKKLTDLKDIKNVKASLSVILSVMKNKEKLPIVKKDGKFQIMK